jgi:hypothetical protein
VIAVFCAVDKSARRFFAYARMKYTRDATTT